VWPGKDHVGYVTSINVATNVLTFIDMNGGNFTDPAQERTDLFGKYDSKSCNLSTSRCRSVRLAGFTASLAGAGYIIANPGYDWSWGSGAYPSVSADCVPG
jgi:hypothetical protein